MTSTPSAAELLAAVQHYLGEVERELPGRLGFHAKVAANVLAIVAREMAAPPAPVEAAALESILGPIGALPEARSALCARLRSGDMMIDTPGLLDALLGAAVAQVGVDNPKYATYQRLTGAARP